MQVLQILKINPQGNPEEIQEWTRRGEQGHKDQEWKWEGYGTHPGEAYTAQDLNWGDAPSM